MPIQKVGSEYVMSDVKVNPVSNVPPLLWAAITPNKIPIMIDMMVETPMRTMVFGTASDIISRTGLPVLADLPNCRVSIFVMYLKYLTCHGS